MKIRSFSQKSEKTSNQIQPPVFEKQSKPAGRARKSRGGKKTLAVVVILFFLVICVYAAYLWLPASAEWLGVFHAGDMIKGQENRAAPTGNSPPESAKANPIIPDKSDAVPGTQKQTTRSETRSTVRPEQLFVKQKPQSHTNNTEENKTVAAGPEPEKPSGSGDARRQVPERLVIYFPHDAYGLSSTSFETLAQAKQLLRQDPQLKADIRGYTDSLGDAEYNRYLSKLRANIVSKYLTGDGVEPEQIKPQGLGPLHRGSRNQTPAERAKNRRVEIVFGYKSR